MLACKDSWSLFDFPAKSAQLKELRASLENPDLWSNPKKLTETNKLIGSLENLIEPLGYLSKQISYLLEIFGLEDQALMEQAELEAQKLEPLFAKAISLMNGPDDNKAAYFCIMAGSGGREACNWAEMLLRMYAKWITKLGLEPDISDIIYNEPDGIKVVMLRVEGSMAYGKLKNETGVHRLSRVSPFDQADRRQTSFAAVDVIPEALPDAEFVIEEKDLDVYYCCGSGPGGQAINKTEVVAVVKHLPTGIIVRSQKTRQQQQNKADALAILKSKLVKLREAEKDAEAAKIKKAAPKAAFGNEYRRTYVLSQKLGIHDHLTGKETTRIWDVMNGDLDLV